MSSIALAQYVFQLFEDGVLDREPHRPADRMEQARLDLPDPARRISQPLPGALLQARLAMVLAERDAAIAERDQALSQNDRLRHLLQQLQRMQFGRRSEKLDPDRLALAKRTPARGA